MTEFRPRRAARVLLVDDGERVLLFHGVDPARPAHDYWFTPGGGLSSGEAPAAGAVRELAEETGLVRGVADLGEPVFQETTEFPFDGVWYRQQQEFFLLRVPTWVVDTTGFDQVEQESITEHRWWSIEELERTKERYYPDVLTAVLRRVLGKD
ncbi:DNA mismatch repair protein MutT [Asanoa ishikariensis]|uniref:ADP-ribose pyrophosphatase YjhB, NUDIX family n=1 Tax=Asanoa ishikariensis TaxID=137265 RepID=A0A1H3RK82_9ACTN|nr:NUDIX domain-containing protein [Asanoa ishikariensis]GIF67114.1 DNA mismatch repair protein MutT [Asanoa ishikariensis]SDZ26144.1 ADP-ribose pyrophosphatase YjhB, NUDIX family [Asanoa ishikariensis]